MNKFKVTIQRKEQTVTKEVNKDSFTIGRSTDCDIHLNETLISRVHVVFTRRWNQIWMEDKNSSNGTFLNGTRVMQGTPVNIVPTDRVQLGRSEYVILVDLETEEVPADLPKAPEEREEVSAPPVAETVAMPPPKDLTFQSEKLLHDAKKKAAQIIMEGEVQAEKRVQAIYQKARDAQEKAENFYQTRLAEAHKEADAILADFQKQGRDLLHEARTMAQEIREEVDSYVQALKQRAKEDADNKVSEGALEAEKMKNEAIAAARLLTDQEAKEVILKAQEEADRLVDFAKLKAHETQAKIKENQETITTLEVKLKQLREDVAWSEKKAAEHKAAEEQLIAHMKKQEQRAREIEAEEKQMEAERIKIEKALNQLKDKQIEMTGDLNDIEAKKTHLFKEYEAHKAALTEKMQMEKTAAEKSEEQRMEELRLQGTQRLQKMERELLDEILRRKESLVKDIYISIEKEIVTQMEPARWRAMSSTIEGLILESIEGKVSSMAQSTLTTEKPVDLLKKRKAEKWRWVMSGVTAGVLLFVGAQLTLEQIKENQAPMEKMVKDQARKRAADLERRRFNPAQSDELKESYTDAVIYTRNFTDIYTDQEFQQKLYKASSHYLLKTWRIEEEKTLQVISAALALVKELKEKKAKIHPDFVKDGVEKMHALEKESRNRMKVILGSEVRLESFRRFEKNLYLEEVQRRQMAQH
ncbi:FHA domain-containing protein [Bdellovibrio sp. HCB2-146]|uniref:FHA domain-containing protein n=1 Tax=Bdellovibrio sp. HCB2-146 TaxID=3394362 RepID=UPI0039BC5B2C